MMMIHNWVGSILQSLDKILCNSIKYWLDYGILNKAKSFLFKIKTLVFSYKWIFFFFQIQFIYNIKIYYFLILLKNHIITPLLNKDKKFKTYYQHKSIKEKKEEQNINQKNFTTSKDYLRLILVCDISIKILLPQE